MKLAKMYRQSEGGKDRRREDKDRCKVSHIGRSHIGSSHIGRSMADREGKDDKISLCNLMCADISMRVNMEVIHLSSKLNIILLPHNWHFARSLAGQARLSAVLGPMQTDSSLSEPGEPRLRIALSCRRTHCIRTLYPHSLESGVQSE